MQTYFGHAVIALTLIGGTCPAAAQWVYSQDPPGTRPIVTTQPLPLTQAQRTIIYRTIIPQGRNRAPIVREQIVTEPVAPAPLARGYYDSDSYAYGYAEAPRAVVREPDAFGSYAYAVGTRLPPTARLAPLPPPVVAAVPAVRSYRYMVVNNRLLLVDPDTGIVVADLTD
jgi:hypothetical protein